MHLTGGNIGVIRAAGDGNCQAAAVRERSSHWLVWNSLQGGTFLCLGWLFLASPFSPQMKRAPGLSVSTLWTRDGWGEYFVRNFEIWGQVPYSYKCWLACTPMQVGTGNPHPIWIHRERKGLHLSGDFTNNIHSCLCALCKIKIVFTSKTDYEASVMRQYGMGSWYETNFGLNFGFSFTSCVIISKLLQFSYLSSGSNQNTYHRIVVKTK